MCIAITNPTTASDNDNADVPQRSDASPDPSALVHYIKTQENPLVPHSPPFHSLGFTLPCFPSTQPAWLQSAMPEGLVAAIRDMPALSRFLETPIPEDLGLVQFRILGDHTEDRVWLAFDYLGSSEEPCEDQSVMTCVRVRRRQLFERRRHYELRDSRGTHLGHVAQTAAGLPLLGRVQQFSVTTPSGSGHVAVTQPMRGPKTVSVHMQSAGDVVAPFPSDAAMETDEDVEHARAVHEYASKPPVWNERCSAYVLNFDGRVTVASSKNLILNSPYDSVQSCADDGSELDDGTCGVSLRFGRVATKTPDRGLSQFSLDVGYPMSPLQAAGVAMSSLLAHAASF